MNSRLEELRRKKAELVKKNEMYMRDLEEKRQGALLQKAAKASDTAGPESASAQNGDKPKAARFPIVESDHINIFTQKQEEKKLKLDEGVTANVDAEKDRLHQANDDVEESESSEHLSRNEEDIEKDMIRFRNSVGKTVFEEANREITYLTEEQAAALFEEQEEEFLTFFEDVEQILNEENIQKKQGALIEDYLFNLNDKAKDQRRDYVCRQLQDSDIEGKYMVNDLIWIQGENMPENIAVCYSRLEEQREQGSNSLDYFVGLYQNDKRTVTKSFRSEIKRIIADDRDHNIIYGGIENGRIALWDVRTHKPAPNDMSSPKDKISFMPVIDLKKRENDIFSVALEGRIHKYDARKMYEPVFSMDLFVVSESHSIVKLESMPSSMEFDPLDPEILYVTTTEGTVYEIGINQNSFQEKQLFQKIANAPITNLKFMDFKNYFKDMREMRKTASGKLKVNNFFVTSSFDWNIKFFKDTLGNEVAVNNYHNDFVTGLDVNNQLCPFTYASADVEGKLAVWKVDQSYMNQPLVEWTNPNAISKIRWNHSGLQLAVGDVRGFVNILTFNKSKLVLSEKMMNYYSTHGLSKLMSD